MLSRLRKIGQYSIVVLATLGRAGHIWWQAVWRRPQAKHFPLLVRQIYQLGVLSVVIIVMSGFSIGAVLALQGYN